MSGMDAFCSQCQERPEEGPCPLHDAAEVWSKDALATIHQAAAQIRNDRGGIVSKNTQDGRRWLPVAAWLDTAGADLWAHGPICCPDGCVECDDALWMPHVRRALAVARAYLAEEPCVAPPGNLCTETGCWDADRCVVKDEGVIERVLALCDRADAREDADRRLVTTAALRAALAQTAPGAQR